MKRILWCSFLLLFVFSVRGQQHDRFQEIEQRLTDLEPIVPGLKEKGDFAISGASIQEFLRGLAEAHNLNINIDPQLNFRLYNNFTGEKVSNIILFVVREYNLDIRFVGTIMSFTSYAAPLTPSQQQPPKEIVVSYNNYNNMLSLDLQNDTLAAVVRKIAQVTKKNLIPAPGVLGKTINAYIEEMPFDNAIEKMAFANNLKVIKTDDNFYIIKPLEEGEDALATGDAASKRALARRRAAARNAQEGAPAGPVLDIDVQDSLGKHFISADAVNVPILDAIKAVAEEAGISYFLFSNITGTTTTHVSNVSFDEFLTYLLQGTEYTYKIDQGLYLVGERRLEGLRAHKVFQFQYRSLDTINDIIPADIKKGVEIKEFKELNSILLTGSLPQINEIIAFIQPLDKVVPMITIEVILLDVRKGKSVTTGIKAGLSDSVRSGGSIFPGLDFTLGSRTINALLDAIPGGATTIGRVTPNFYVTLSALEENENVEVRQMPKLSTLNGHEANLSIGSTRYFAITTQNVLGTLNPQTVVTQQFNAVEANLAINIKPVVSGDDHVTLSIDVNISDFIGNSPPLGPPPTSKSQFKSIVRVRNEEMIVLGGLERMEKSDQGSGVPFLSRIPVIKWLFSSRTRSKSKVVSIVFIKPTIIY